MRLWIALTAPYAGAYSRLTGAPLDDETLARELARRGRFLPSWALGACACGALFLRFLAPLLLIGRPVLFDSLSEDEADRLLGLLQRTRFLPLKLAFLVVKTVVLPVRYGRAETLAAIGYGREP